MTGGIEKSKEKDGDTVPAQQKVQDTVRAQQKVQIVQTANDEIKGSDLLTIWKK